MSSTAADFAEIRLPSGVAIVDGPGGLPVLEIKTVAASARIFIQGAHLTEWIPAGAKPVLFTSGQTFYKTGKAIRGGVPVCFPWFANRAGRPDSPAHGFVRTADWIVKEVSTDAQGTVTAVFGFHHSEATVAHWPHEFVVTYTIKAGRELEMIFAVENLGSTPLTYEAALHTYLTVSDATQVSVGGLENVEYIDKVDGGARKKTGTEPLKFTGETDRVFLNTTSDVTLEDPGYQRNIVVAKEGSATTVVWNPWTEKAKAMADFGDGEWKEMLCIETANSGENSVTVAPGASHSMIARVRLA